MNDSDQPESNPWNLATQVALAASKLAALTEANKPAPPTLPANYIALDDPRFDHLCHPFDTNFVAFRTALHGGSTSTLHYFFVNPVIIYWHREALGPIAAAQGELYMLEQQLAALKRQAAATPVAQVSRGK